MSRPIRIALRNLTLGLLLIGRVPAEALAQPPSDPAKPVADEAIWTAMNSTIAQEALEVIDEVQAIRKDLDDLKAFLQEARDRAEQFEDEAQAQQRDPTAALLRLAEVLANRSEGFRTLVGWTAEMQAKVDELRRAADGVAAMAQQFEDVSEDDLRAMVVDLVKAEAAAELFEVVDGRVLRVLDQLRDPAKAARSLVDGQIRQALSTPWEVGGLVFRIKELGALQPIFSPEANLTIVMQYLDGDLPDVEASGLYFGRDGTPKFDRLKFSADAKSLETLLMQKGLTKLGNAIGDLGLPLKFQNLKTLGFDKPGPGGRRGGLQFDLEANLALGGMPLPKLKQDGIQIFSDGYVHMNGATSLKYKDPTNTPIPIATTGLAFHDHAVELTLKPEKVAISTILSAAAPGSGKAIGLEVVCGFGFPIRKIEFEGTMQMAGGLKFARVSKGELSPERIQADLEMPIPGGSGEAALAAIAPIEAKGHFHIDKEGLIATGKVILFKGPSVDSELFIGTNGHGHITATTDFQLFNLLKVGGEMESRFTPGFQRLTANVVGTVDLDLQLFRVSVALNVDADTDRLKNGKLPIHVEASALGARVVVDLPSFTPADFQLVIEALKKQMPDMYKNMLRALAAFEGHAAEVLAAEEAKIRNAVSDAAARAGVDAIRTGDPNVDKALGDISQGGKQVIAAMVDAREFTGKSAAHFRESSTKELDNLGKDPFGTIAKAPQNALKELGNLGDSIGGLLGGGGKGDDEGDARRRAEDAARAKSEELQQKLQVKLGKLVAAIEGDKLDLTPKPTRQVNSRGQGLNESTRLRLMFEHSASAPWGSDKPESGEVMFLVRATGMRSTINTRYPDRSRRDAGSDVQAGWVYFQDLFKPDATPKARIGIRPLKHHSALTAEALASDEIQRLVELHVPEAEIEGVRKLYERKLAIKNETAEPLIVWVKAEGRVRDNEGFAWRWTPADPGDDGASAFLIPARSTKILGEEVAPSDPARSVAGEAHAATATPADALKGRRVRIWAESETGDRWESERNDDRWIVPKNPQMLGERAYRDDKVQVFTYVIKPKTGLRPFAERQLSLRNDTPEPLELKLRYRSVRGGQARWFTLPEFVLEPGETVRPRGTDGFAVRASRITFEAEGPMRRYTAHESAPVWLVAESEGRRVYRGTKIGTYTHRFRPDTRGAQASQATPR